MRKLAVVLAVAVVALAPLGCTTDPAVVAADSAPDYVIVQQTVGLDESEETRLAVDARADQACRAHGRRAELPATSIECAFRHWLLGTCIIQRYHFACR